jgi:hypothetical protein
MTPLQTGSESLIELETLVRQGMAGDQSVLPALRTLLDSRPELWQDLRTLGDRVRQAWLQRMTGTDVIAQEILTRQLQALQADVAGPAATPLEHLLIERIALCWLQMQQADLTAAQMLAKPSPVQESWVQQRQDRAQGRLLSAIKALAQVRKLLRPSATVQVNIAQQVNVGT